MNPADFINKSFGTYTIRGLEIEPTYWQAAAIVFLLFLLVLTFARIRWLYIHWSFGKGSFSFLFYGFLLALVLEGFLIIGGRTFMTEILGWENAPKPISTALEAGRAKLVQVLGATDEIPESVASEPPTYQSVVSDFQSLSPDDAESVRSFVCAP